MASRRASGANNRDGPRDRGTATDKIACILALILVKDVPEKNERVLLLHTAGFDNGEISKLLHMNVGSVKVALSRAKKGKKRQRDG